MNHEWPISWPSTRSMKSCCWTACPRLGTAAWCKWWHRSCGWVPLMRSTASLDPRTRSLQDPWSGQISQVDVDQDAVVLRSVDVYWVVESVSTIGLVVLLAVHVGNYKRLLLTDGQISVERSMSLFGWIIRRSCQPEMLGLLGINSPWTITHGERDKLFGQISTVPIFDV